MGTSVMSSTALERQMEHLFYLDAFDARQIVTRLTTHGACSVPLLREEFRQALLQEARSARYSTEPASIGQGAQRVCQDVATQCVFAPESLYHVLRGAFQQLLDTTLGVLSPSPFASPLRLTEMRLHRYSRGSLGMTPHQDGACFCNLVCVFMLGGRGEFGLCTDHHGRQPRWLDGAPGQVIFMRAPGFLPANTRPFHFVRDIRTDRYTLGLRQRAPRQPYHWWEHEVRS